jgi:hypothetical protein
MLLAVASCTVLLSVGDSIMDMINKGIEAGNKIAQLLANKKKMMILEHLWQILSERSRNI